MSYAKQYLEEVHRVVDSLKVSEIDLMVQLLVNLREKGGRLFFLGAGGGAGNASHAVNDFRKICGIESYTPSDNVSELSARVNDDGWDTVFLNWLQGSKLCETDGVFVFSVGGGNAEQNISANLVYALEHAKEVGAKIFGVVGRDGGFTAQVADACVIIPTVNPETTTPHTESFQAVIWHLIVSHPDMKRSEMKWESVKWQMKPSAIFLDRDGVINKALVRHGKAFSPRTRNEFVILNESVQAIKSMKAAGFKVIVITNQPDIARGKLSFADLKWMTKRIMTETAVDEVLVCPHDDHDNCDCRKPKPGMLLKSLNKWEIDLSRSYIIGDGWKDMEAGKVVGCTCILFDEVYNKGVECNFLVRSLQEAAELILNREGRR